MTEYVHTWTFCKITNKPTKPFPFVFKPSTRIHKMYKEVHNTCQLKQSQFSIIDIKICNQWKAGKGQHSFVCFSLRQGLTM